ncbi:MAG: energy transducer TonB [Bacteroidales bacterium]|nr:energy transducer TonB [Bacteroidales bacterium]
MKRILFLFACLATTFFAHAQSNEVTLVVSGEGSNKTDATTMALRSAIEQAYGTFVSANTEILNDEIVRDEIATVSSGNIKSYKEISSVQTTEGYYVTVQAMVSIGKLIEYSKSHGSSAEFAGQTFAMNIKLRKLNKENEVRALENLLKELREISKDLFDLSIDVDGEPYKSSCGIHDDRKSESVQKDVYMVKVSVKHKSNGATRKFFNTLKNTLSALSLTEQEVEDYKKSGEECYPVAIGKPVNTYSEVHSYDFEKYSAAFIANLRNNPNDFLDQLYTMLKDAVYGSVVLDLNGCGYNYVYYYKEFDAYSGYYPNCYWCVRMTVGMIRGNIILVPSNKDYRSVAGMYKKPNMDDYYRMSIGQNRRFIYRLITIEGFDKFISDGDNLFDLNFEIPVKEEDLMNLTGFSVHRKGRPVSSTPDKSTQNNLENKQSTQPATKTASQPVIGKDDEVYQIAENMPKFPGEDQKMWEFISHNIQYPQEALEKRIQGRVFVGFIVEPDGSLSDVKVLRSLGGGCDEEAMRVIKSMPKWEPGKQRGQAVRVSYQIPVDFRLQ